MSAHPSPPQDAKPLFWERTQSFTSESQKGDDISVKSDESPPRPGTTGNVNLVSQNASINTSRNRLDSSNHSAGGVGMGSPRRWATTPRAHPDDYRRRPGQYFLFFSLIVTLTLVIRNDSGNETNPLPTALYLSHTPSSFL